MGSADFMAVPPHTAGVAQMRKRDL